MFCWYNLFPSIFQFQNHFCPVFFHYFITWEMKPAMFLHFYLPFIWPNQMHGKTNCGRLTWLCYMCYNPGWNLWMVGLSIQQHMKWTLVSWPGPNCRKKSFLYLVFEFCFSPFPGNTVRLHCTIISENANVHQFVTPSIASICVCKDFFNLSK